MVSTGFPSILMNGRVLLGCWLAAVRVAGLSGLPRRGVEGALLG